ncbi:Alpha-1,2 mannosyltransferase [Hortaea werneckii]|nr:Alpha-1,2 mannosyltransferase [Hortaea werneckii]KAI7593100.1 Alpha-1,2 mannosyltransferase [Hortaea werneckii]
MRGLTLPLIYLLIALLALFVTLHIADFSSARVPLPDSYQPASDPLWDANTFPKGDPSPSSTTVNSPIEKAPIGGQNFCARYTVPGDRMNATFITLALNSDVWEISHSIRQVEDRFNCRYNYDWVFLNDEDFDETFKSVTSALASGRTRYGKIDSAHWGFPDFVDQEKATKAREDMQERTIPYGNSVSYRHMCRYESGSFFRHKLLLQYEWYWRVEPSIELFCDLRYDPFLFMAEHNK